MNAARNETTQPGESKLLNKAAIAQFLGVTPRTVNSWMANGTLPHYRLSPHCVRFKLADVQARLDERNRVTNSVRRK
jgi:excisionase family DNA binding protein